MARCSKVRSEGKQDTHKTPQNLLKHHKTHHKTRQKQTKTALKLTKTTIKASKGKTFWTEKSGVSSTSRNVHLTTTCSMGEKNNIFSTETPKNNFWCFLKGYFWGVLEVFESFLRCSLGCSMGFLGLRRSA